MKKLTLLFLGLFLMPAHMLADVLCNTCDKLCECEVTNHTFLGIRPLFRSVDPILISSFRDDLPDKNECGIGGAAELVFFGSKSTNPHDLARYFFPFCKNEIIVDEQVFVNQEPRDLMAQNFNIYTVNGNFRSKISIAPRQSVVGVGLYYRQSIWEDECWGRGIWTSISTSVQRIKNFVDLCETIINDGGGVDLQAATNPQPNMTAALSQPDWFFGKICTGSMTKTGLADIEWKLGYEWMERQPCHLESYIGLLIPTGNKPRAQFLFEPIVGNGHHWGIMLGSATGVRIWQNKEETRSIRIEYNLHTVHLFSNIQCRSLNLNQKPWTRYIEMYANEEQAQQALNLFALGDPLAVSLSTPGINILTQPVKVHPGYWFNMTTAFVYNGCNFMGEAGYNLFARRSDCVKLACPWKLGPAIKRSSGAGETNPVRDITGNFILESNDVQTSFADYNLNLIKESDLDLSSAATPCMLSHTFYAAAGYQWVTCGYPMFLNLGSSYEFSTSNNAVLERWSAWGKVGISF